MILKLFNTVLLIAGLVLLPAGAAQAGPDTARGVVEGYLEDARAGRWEAAARWWLPEDLERAERLGITYHDIPFKLDASSYLMMPGVAAAGEPVIGPPVGDPEEGPVRFEVTFPTNPPARSHYVAVRYETGWRLAAPVTALTRDWEVREFDYIRFRLQPGHLLLRKATAELDLFVHETGQRLGLSEERMALLAREKIDYVLCDDDIVEAIAGAPTKGVAVLPVDAVVTSEPFHAHELAHLLVGYAAQDLGLYVLPSLQEGIAVHLGGRWGRSAAVTNELGRYVVGEGIADIDAFLAWHDFRNQLPDLVYAPAGILAGYLLHELGPADFVALYRDYSGWPGDLMAADRDAIRQDFESRLGLEPRGLDAAVAEFAAILPGGGIEPGLDDVAGERSVLEGDGYTAEITVGEEWVAFDIAFEDAVRGGAIMVGPPGATKASGRLFAERFPGREYRGEMGAVIFSDREAGYYDFETDILRAKYVYDFRPDPTFATSGNRVTFRVRRDLLPEGVKDLFSP